MMLFSVRCGDADPAEVNVQTQMKEILHVAEARPERQSRFLKRFVFYFRVYSAPAVMSLV